MCFFDGGGRNILRGGKWGTKGREAGDEGEGSGGKGVGSGGWAPPVHPHHSDSLSRPRALADIQYRNKNDK